MQSCNHHEKARAFPGTGFASTTDDHTVSGCAIATFQFRKGCVLKERTAVRGHSVNRSQQCAIKRRIDPRLATGNGCCHQKQISDLDIIFYDHIGKTGGIRDRVAIFKHSRQMHGQGLRGIAIAFLDRIPGTGTTGKVRKEGAVSALFIGFDYDRKSLLHVIIALLGDHAGKPGSPEPDTTLFFNAPKGTYFQILFRMRDCDAPRLGWVAEMMMAACRLNFVPSVRLDPLDDFPALHHPSVVDALYIHTYAHHCNTEMRVYVYLTCRQRAIEWKQTEDLMPQRICQFLLGSVNSLLELRSLRLKVDQAVICRFNVRPFKHFRQLHQIIFIATDKVFDLAIHHLETVLAIRAIDPGTTVAQPVNIVRATATENDLVRFFRTALHQKFELIHDIPLLLETRGKGSFPAAFKSRKSNTTYPKWGSSYRLTNQTDGHMVSAINGKNPLWRRENLLFKTASRHVSCGYFCARIPGASRLWREGGEYKTLRGNKPACLLTGFRPPATSAVSKSLVGGLFNSHQEGFNMTDKLISFDQIETTEQAAMLLNQLYDGLEGIALLIEAGHKEQAASIARMSMTACLMVTPPLEETIADLDEQIDTTPRKPIAWRGQES